MPVSVGRAAPVAVAVVLAAARGALSGTPTPPPLAPPLGTTALLMPPIPLWGPAPPARTPVAAICRRQSECGEDECERTL